MKDLRSDEASRNNYKPQEGTQLPSLLPLLYESRYGMTECAQKSTAEGQTERKRMYSGREHTHQLIWKGFLTGKVIRDSFYILVVADFKLKTKDVLNYLQTRAV